MSGVLAVLSRCNCEKEGFNRVVLQHRSLQIRWRQVAAFQVKHPSLTAAESTSHEERVPGNVNTREQALSV